jgi:hypothetical protein
MENSFFDVSLTHQNLLKIMIVNIQRATQLTGKSRSSIERHIKQGKLSKTVEGIDTSELLRVYGAFVPNTDTSNDKSADKSLTHREQWLMRQIEELKREHLEREKQFLEREQKLMLLLEHLPQKSNSKELWNRVFKKREKIL